MSDSGSELRTRRALLTGGIGGLAALIAGAVLRPLPAAAASGGNVVLGQSNDSDLYTTSIASDGSAITTHTVNNGTGDAVRGTSTQATGVHGHGFNGVYGTSNSGGTSVYGAKFNGTGPAVKGENQSATNGYAAVYGLTNGTGPAVYGEGTAQGNGTSGVARGTGSGVYGQSDNGRGGRFSGKKAQLKLDPSAATTHPASGDPGDIFLDKSKRLWLCKGGTTWVRLDL